MSDKSYEEMFDRLFQIDSGLTCINCGGKEFTSKGVMLFFDDAFVESKASQSLYCNVIEFKEVRSIATRWECNNCGRRMYLSICHRNLLENEATVKVEGGDSLWQGTDADYPTEDD